MDYIVDGILEARILGWIVTPFSKGSSQPRDQTQVSCIAGRFFTSWATMQPKVGQIFSIDIQTLPAHWNLICQSPGGWKGSQDILTHTGQTSHLTSPEGLKMQCPQQRVSITWELARKVHYRASPQCWWIRMSRGHSLHPSKDALSPVPKMTEGFGEKVWTADVIYHPVGVCFSHLLLESAFSPSGVPPEAHRSTQSLLTPPRVSSCPGYHLHVWHSLFGDRVSPEARLAKRT